MQASWEGKRVLITGGLGFIGSNLAVKLHALGAKITILDSLNPLYGGNMFNVVDIKDELEIIIGDVRDREKIEDLIVGRDYIFDFAAQVRHTDSINMPVEDLEVSCLSKLYLLDACKRKNPDVKIIFASSRMVYGKNEGSELISEKTPVDPMGLYAIHKFAVEKYLKTYGKEFGIKSTILRISNPYGPRQQIKHSKYSLPGWFIRQAMESNPIKIFGDGLQIRDYIYIDDLIEAIISLAPLSSPEAEVYNCGSGEAVVFKEMIEKIIEIVGSGSVQYVPWPKEYAVVETGNSEMDISKIKNATGWMPKVFLEEGLKKTYLYYKEHKEEYVGGNIPVNNNK